MASESSVQRKIKELKNLNKEARDKGHVIQSPFYNDEEKNPCIKEQNLSARCSVENNADRVVCKDFMENYVMCVKFWDMVQMRRRLNSEYPILPPPEEREAIKQFYTDEYRNFVRKLVAKEKRFYGMKK